MNEKFVQYLDCTSTFVKIALLWHKKRSSRQCLGSCCPSPPRWGSQVPATQHPAALLGCEAEDTFRCTIWYKHVASPRSLAICQCKPELGKSWASLLWLQLKSSTGSRPLLSNKCGCQICSGRGLCILFPYTLDFLQWGWETSYWNFILSDTIWSTHILIVPQTEGFVSKWTIL